MLKSHFSIIVADDEKDVVDSVSSYLEELAKRFKDHIQIYRTLSASEVLDVLSKHSVDVLLLDYHFEGGISGDEIIDRIADPFGQKLIIMMSARDKEEIEEIIIKRHAHLGTRFKFLRKPFDYLEVQDRYLEIKNFLSERPYPFLLAHTKRVLLTTSTSQGKITAMKDLIESLIKYSVSILAADLGRLPEEDRLNLRIKLNVGLTMGAWIKWLQNLLDYFVPGKNTSFMPELIQLFSTHDNEQNWALEFIYKFKNEVRDVEIGHGFVKDEAWYATLVEKYYTSIISLFDQCAFVTRYVLIVPELIDFPEDDSKDYLYDVRLLMGTDTSFKMTKLRSQLRMRRGEIYLYGPKGEILSLYPFLKFGICEKCSLGRLNLVEDVSPKQMVYNAFCNHRHADVEARNFLNSKFPYLK